MSSPSDRIATLLAWCADNGIIMDPRLQIRETMDNGLAVFSVETIIGEPASLVQIPKAAVLSVRSSLLSGAIGSASYGEQGAHLSLALALFIEILKGPTSRWFGYIQSFPPGIVDTALFWGFDDGASHTTTPQTNPCAGNDGINSSTEGEDEFARFRRLSDGREALMWLRGTEVLKQLRGSENNNTSLLDQIRDYHASTVLPLASRLPFTAHQATLSGFYRAYSLVSSRAFLADAYHGLAMVPIADTFNHSQENHVQFESDFYVCSTCGSVRECIHDVDDESSGHSDPALAKVTAGAANALTRKRGNAQTRETARSNDYSDDFYEMVSCAPIMPGSEVYNAYGDKLGNAQLLAQYGFLLDGNEHDRITFDLAEFDELVGSSAEHHRLAALWRQVYHKWFDEDREGLTSESKLVYSESGVCAPVPGRDRSQGPDDDRKGKDKRVGFFRLNADGKITSELWMFCVLVGMHKAEPASRQRCVGEVVKLIRAVMDLQIVLEEVASGMIDADVKDGGALLFEFTPNQHYSSIQWPPAGQEMSCDGRSSSSSPTATMAMTIQAVVSLCRSKMAKLGKVGADLANLGDTADGLPEDMTRTRLAVTQVMCEYSLLRACESGWTELGSAACPRGYLPLTHPDAVI